MKITFRFLKKIFLILMSLSIMLVSTAYANKKYSLGSIAENEDPTKAKKSNLPVNKKKEAISLQDIDQGNPLANKKPSEYNELLKHLEFLLSRSKTKEEKEKNLFNLVSVRLMLARMLLSQGKNETQKKVALKQLNESYSDTKSLIETNKGNKKKQALAHYLAGVILIELDKEPKNVLNHFNRALDLDPGSNNNPIMSIYIAEELFEKEQYTRAVEYYSRYHNLMTPFQKSLADFKSAWSHINLKNFIEAERLFMSIVLDTEVTAFRKDSAITLAYVMTQHRDEDAIMKSTQSFKSLIPLESYIDFLETLHSTILDEVSGEAGKKVITELFIVQKDPLKKAEYLLKRVPYNATLFASKNHYQTLMLVFNEFEKNNIQISKLPSHVKDNLGVELERLIRSYVETFAGRTKTPEPLTKNDISEYLKKVFTIYVNHYNDKKAYLDVVKIWLDICVDVKDHLCVYKISQLIDRDKRLLSLSEQGDLERLVSLEELTKQDEKKYKAEFIKRLENFAQKHENSKIWGEVTLKLLFYYGSEKNYNKSIPLLKARYEKFKDKEDYFKLQEALYESSQFQVLVQSRNEKLYSEDQRLTPLLRESVLQLANTALKVKDFKKYETNIQLFLSLNPEKDKAIIAEKNYLTQMWELKRTEDVQKKLFSYNLDKRFSDDFLPYIKNLSSYYSQMGDFLRALEVLQGSDKIKNDPLFNERLLLEVSTKKQLNEQDYLKLNLEQKKYVLGLYVLSFPEQAFQLLYTIKNNLSDFEKNLALLAFRLSKKNMNSIVPRQIASVLGDVVPKDQLDYGLTSAEEKLKKIQFKEFKKFDKSAETYIANLLNEVRASRTALLHDLKGLPYKIQLRGFQAALEVERKCAEVLMGMPIPDVLQPDQIEEYRTGVKQMTKEFSDQAALYEKSIQELNLRSVEDEKSSSKSLAQPDMNRWPWPSRKELVVPLSSAKNAFGSLLYLDFLKNEKKINISEYAILRVGLLLRTHPENQAMRDYLVLELKNLKQDAVINRWERIQVL